MGGKFAFGCWATRCTTTRRSALARNAGVGCCVGWRVGAIKGVGDGTWEGRSPGTLSQSLRFVSDASLSHFKGSPSELLCLRTPFDPHSRVAWFAESRIDASPRN